MSNDRTVVMFWWPREAHTVPTALAFRLRAFEARRSRPIACHFSIYILILVFVRLLDGSVYRPLHVQQPLDTILQR